MKGRVQWETAFFGLLAAVGLAALLVAMLLGALFAVDATDSGDTAADHVDRVVAGGGAIAIAILGLAYLTGGYVAGRMARFAGWKQGLAVWLLSALVAAVVLITAWIAGGELDPTRSIDMPSNPVDEGPLGSGPVLVLVSAALALGLSLAGGVLGERFHRALDREELEAEPEQKPEEPDTEQQPETETEPENEPASEREAEEREVGTPREDYLRLGARQP
jgi:hypothetical protein